MKKHLKYILTLITCICLMFNSVVPVYATETETETDNPSIVDRVSVLFDNYVNRIALEIGICADYIKTDANYLWSDFKLALKSLDEGCNYFEFKDDNTLLVSTDADGNFIIPADLLEEIKKHIREKYQPPYKYVAYRNTHDGLTMKNYGLPSSYTHFASAVKFFNGYFAGYAIAGGSCDYWYRVLNKDFKYAYLNNNRVRFVDSDYIAVNCVDYYAMPKNPDFSNMEQYYTYSGDGFNLTNGSNENETFYVRDYSNLDVPYFEKLQGTGYLKVYSSLEALMSYEYGSPTAYFTQKFFETSTDLTVSINDINKYNQQFMQNLYNEIKENLKNAVTADDIENIINSTVSKKLEELSGKLDNVDDNLTDISGKLDSVISELKNILDKLGLLYEVDENGNVVIKNFNFDIDLNANVVIPIIDKLAEINNELNVQLKFQSEKLGDLSDQLTDIHRFLRDMLEGQSKEYDLLVEKFNSLFSTVGQIKSEIHNTYVKVDEINTKLNILDTIKQQLSDIYNKMVEILEAINNLELTGLNIDFSGSPFDDMVKVLNSIDNKLNILIGLETINLVDELFGEDDPGDVINGISSQSTITDLLATKFPFSVPWDIALAFNVLAHEPVCPVLDIPLKLNIFNTEQEFNIHIDGTEFEYISYLSRTSLTMAFAVSLAIFTYKNFKKK